MLLTKDGRAKVYDFGTSLILDPGNMHVSSMTIPSYKAPEFIQSIYDINRENIPIRFKPWPGGMCSQYFYL